METLASERICRLCGKQLHNSMAIHIFDSPNNYETKIRTLLPILIHEMDCLPKYLCHSCSNKLQELHNFYMQTMKFDIEMKKNLSWMENKSGSQRDAVPTVYFADLNTIKIKSEIENFENCDTTQQNTNFNLMKSINVDCSMKQLNANYHDGDDEFSCLPTSTTSDDNEHHCNNENNRIPLSVTVPLVRINNQLQGGRIVKVLKSKLNLTDTGKKPAQQQQQQPINAHSSNKNHINDSTNKNCSLTVPKVLIKNETKENNEFVRKLRPRLKSISNKSTAKIIKQEELNEYFTNKMDNKPRDFMTDLKLSKKVEVKVEKLNRGMTQNVATTVIHSNCNKTINKNINNNFTENKYNIRKKQKLEINDVRMEKLKPLRTQNNLKDMGTYASKVEVHMKSITVKLTKINVAQLKKQRRPRRSRDKISKIKKNKKIHDTYSCERCNQLFTKRELYRLHFCYLH